MKLSDIMSAMHLNLYAELPLLIFFGVFLGVIVHLLQGRERFEHARHLPLAERVRTEDEEPKP